MVCRKCEKCLEEKGSMNKISMFKLYMEWGKSHKYNLYYNMMHSSFLLTIFCIHSRLLSTYFCVIGILVCPLVQSIYIEKWFRFLLSLYAPDNLWLGLIQCNLFRFLCNLTSCVDIG